MMCLAEFFWSNINGYGQNIPTQWDIMGNFARENFDQWLQQKVKFFLGFYLKLVIQWGKWTFGGGESIGANVD